MAGQIKHVQEVEKNRHLNEKDAQMQCLSAQVKRIAQLQARGRFTLILGYDIQMYMLIVEDPTVNYVTQL